MPYDRYIFRARAALRAEEVQNLLHIILYTYPIYANFCVLVYEKREIIFA